MKRYLALAVLILALAFTAAFPAALQIDMLLSQVRSASGSLAGGKVYFYAAGTSTPKDVYLDINKTPPAAANPYTLDANGTAQLYGDGTYRVVIKTAAGVTVYDRDNLKFEDLATDFINSEYTIDLKPKSLTGNDTGNITGYDNITATTRVRAPSIGSASHTDNGYFLNVISKSSPYIDARAYLPSGYVTDGSVDYSTQINEAITAAYALGGGVVLLPPTMIYKAINLILKDGVILMGSPQGIGFLPSSITRTKILAAGAGVVIDTAAGGVTGAGVIGIDIQGLGSGTAVKGIRIQAGNWNQIKNVTVNNVSDEGVVIVAGAADVIEDVLVTNAVLDRTQGNFIGAVDIGGTDHYVHRVEATISGSTEGTVQSASLYHVGLMIRMSSGFVSDSIGEFSDIGIYVEGDWNRISNCRADHNYGHGFYNNGGANQFSNCLSLENSQDTDNAYDGWYASSSSANGQYSNCKSESLGISGGGTKVHRYGFNDQQNGDANKNQYVNVKDYQAGTAGFLNQSSGSSFMFPEGPPKTIDNTTTPSVAGYTNWVFANTDNTTITNFDGGVYGQKITLQVGNVGVITITHGTNIFTNTGANKDLAVQRIYTFLSSGGYWYEQ